MTARREGRGAGVTERAARRRAATEAGARRDLTRPPLPEPLPVDVVDSHCHLDIADGPAGSSLAVGEALAMAALVGVPRVVCISYDLPSSRWVASTTRTYDGLIGGVGIHPNEAPARAAAGELDAALAEVDHLAASTDRVRAVGETGLDYFRTGVDGRPAQHESFRAQIAIARRHDKTLVVHDRDAHADVLRVLDDEGIPDRVVMHCFSGDADFAAACLDLGCYLSFAGTVTFKNAEPLREALRVTPLDRLLVETDAPFLTPMPYRGRPNASYLIPLTVRSMAQVLDAELPELCGAIAANTVAAFGGDWPATARDLGHPPAAIGR